MILIFEKNKPKIFFGMIIGISEINIIKLHEK